MSYLCKTCGKIHDALPHVGIDKPDHYWDVAEEEREKRIELTEDTCIIDHENFLIRGVIEIQIHDYPNGFGLGVWISQKRENFYQYVTHPDSDEIGPYFGWLCTRIAYFEDNTLLLKTQAIFRKGNLRPLIELEPTDHPLAVAQREGITLYQAWEIVNFYSSNFGGRS